MINTAYYNLNQPIKPTESALVIQMLKKDGKSCENCLSRTSQGKCLTKQKYVMPYSICEYHGKIILK